jgi:hypothetical protein
VNLLSSPARLSLILQFDTTFLTSFTSGIDSSSSTATASQFNGQPSAFGTLTLPLRTSSSARPASSRTVRPSVQTLVPPPPDPTNGAPPSGTSPSLVRPSGGAGFSTGIYIVQSLCMLALHGNNDIGYTVGTAVGGSVGGIIIISLLLFWYKFNCCIALSHTDLYRFRAHKKKKLRLSVSNGFVPSNKLGEKSQESNVNPTRAPPSTSPQASGVGTGTHVRKLDGGRNLKSTNTL